jgi:hypothetical protein
VALSNAERQKNYRRRQRTGEEADQFGYKEAARLKAKALELRDEVWRLEKVVEDKDAEIVRLRKIANQRDAERALFGSPPPEQGKPPVRAEETPHLIERCPHCRGRLDGFTFR